jgi:diguanylate cyclase (GGDEF)-like protein
MLMAAFLIASVGIIRRINTLPGVIPLFLFYLMAFTWVLAYLMFTAHPDPETALLFYRYSLAAKSYACVFLLLFAIHFTSPYMSIKPRIWILILIIPSATLLFTILNQKIIFRQIEIILFYPSKHLSILKGVWFYADAFYGYICLLLSIVFFVGHYRISSVLYKWQSSIFIVAIALFSILNLTSLRSGYDSEGSLLGLVTLCVILFFTYLYYKTSDLAFLTTGAVFDKISSIVIIVESNGNILFMNTLGRQKFSFISPNCEGMPYKDLIDIWLRERSGTIQHENGATIISVEENTRHSYELLTSSVTDKNEITVGSFIELRDITVQQDVIAKLYQMVNYDQLTGVFNRRFFEEERERFDKAEFLPLTFITGDLNELKSVNDTYGHTYGDRLIIAAAETLSKFSPDNGRVFRMGGDEFVVLIPNSPEAGARDFIEKVYSFMSEYTEEPFGRIDISLGFAVRDSMRVSIDQTLEESDMVMYKDKKQKKISFRQDARTYNK